MRRPGCSLLVVVVVACGPQKSSTTGAESTGSSSDEASSGSTGSTGATSVSSTSSPTSGSSGAGESSSGSSGGATFIVGLDGGACTKSCDPWVQDCCHGERCVPYSGDGDPYFESVRCVPEERDPVPVGGPCLSKGIGTGIDDCVLGAICWDIDPETSLGTCVAQCKGSPEQPDCSAQPGTVCIIGHDGVVNICLTSCDPLVQDCPIGQTCLPPAFAPQESPFVCVPDLSGAQAGLFMPCIGEQHACDPGLICLDATAAVECDPNADGCCLQFCDLDDPACAGTGTQCAAWYPIGEAPAGYEDVGVCVLP